MNEELQRLFNQLIQISAALYLAMSAYMGRLNFTGMARWLRLQSDEERTHMLTLIERLALSNFKQTILGRRLRRFKKY